MGNFTRYYQVVFLLFVFNVIFNLQFSLTFSNDVCTVTSTRRIGRLLYEDTNSTDEISDSSYYLEELETPDITFQNFSVNLTEENFPYRILQNTVNVTKNATSLTTFPMVIAIVYGIDAGLTLLTFLLFCYFEERVSKEFGKFGFFWKCFGVILRIFPLLMTLIHIVLGIFIVVQFYFIFGDQGCRYAIHDTGKAFLQGKMWSDSITVNIVTAVVWFLIHCLGPQLRKAMFNEPFYYIPVDEGRNPILQFCCYRFGV